MQRQRDPGDESQSAEAIGLAALLFVTEDEARLTRFLADTGLMPAELRETAGTPGGLAAVLDHLLGDESLLMVFAATAGLDPAQIGPARDTLAGGKDAQRFAAEHHTSGHTGGGGRKKASKRWPGPGG